MKLKINTAYKPPKPLAHESIFDCNRRIGAYMLKTTGRIGQGTKVHRFTIEVVDTPGGLGLVSVWNICGSAKWNSYLTPIFDDALEITCTKCQRGLGIVPQTETGKQKQEEVTMAKKATKALLAKACEIINGTSLRNDKDAIRIGAKDKMDDIIRVFAVAMDEINAAGKLNSVPEKAFEIWQLVANHPVAVASTTVGVDYDDTPEGKMAAAAKATGENTGTTKANAAKEDAKQIKKEAAAKAKTEKAAAKTKAASATALAGRKFTKAMAFWKCLTDNPVTDKKALAEMLRTNHGNGSEAEAKFWTNNYLNLLVETGLVEVKGQAVTLIER